MRFIEATEVYSRKHAVVNVDHIVSVVDTTEKDGCLSIRTIVDKDYEIYDRSYESVIEELLRK